MAQNEAIPSRVWKLWENISQETRQTIESEMKKENIAGLYFEDHSALDVS